MVRLNSYNNDTICYNNVTLFACSIAKVMVYLSHKYNYEF